MSYSDHVTIEQLEEELDSMSDAEFIALLYRSGFELRDPETDERLKQNDLLNRYESLAEDDLKRFADD